MNQPAPHVSIIVPVYNEADNIPRLCQQVRAAMAGAATSWELVVVDDGSTDGTTERLVELTQTDERLRVVVLRRNFGQTAALLAGIDESRGAVLVTMDGDLQNDPADIPMMLAKLDEGYDLVHGWRRRRQDAWLSRKLPSRLANWLIARVTRFPVHDLGCTLKVIRREIATELELYGEMHRFIPILAHQRGARCVEVETRHHPRQFGRTKYGIGRTVRVVLDLLTVKYMLDYFASPMKLFGGFGLLCVVAALACAAATIAMKVTGGTDMTGNPLLLGSAIAALAGLQFFSLGLIGEVTARIYFGQRRRPSYAVRRVVSRDSTDRRQVRAA